MPDYDLEIVYTISQKEVKEHQYALLTEFAKTSFLSGIIAFIVIFLLGRKIIVSPFQKLENSQRAITSAIEGIAYVKASGRFLEINDAYANVFQYKKKDLFSKNYKSLFYKKDIPIFEMAYHEMIQKGKSRVDLRGVKNDRTTFFMQLSLVKQSDQYNDLSGFHIFIQDITERKEAEMHNLMLSNIIENTNDLVVVSEPKDQASEGKIVYINPSFNQKSKSLKDQFISQKMNILFEPEVINEIDKKINTESSFRKELRLSFNQRIWCDVNMVKIKDDFGKINYFSWIIRDIDEERKNKTLLNKTLKDLKKSNNELEKFAYIASHDLKSPLRAIDAISVWLEEDLKPHFNEESTKNIKQLKNRIHRMECLLDDLLQYSRIGHQEEKTKKVKASEIIDDIIHLISIPDGFSISYSKRMEEISVNRIPLYQIFNNLITNALKHHDKEKGHIRIEAEDLGNQYQFSVIDDGPGIDKKYYNKIFEMFQTLRPRDEIEGSGMGLAMVKKIVNTEGGDISIESFLGKGSRFILTWLK